MPFKCMFQANILECLKEFICSDIGYFFSLNVFKVFLESAIVFYQLDISRKMVCD